MFRVGDIVRGKKGNGYYVLSEDMLRAEVIYAEGNEMKIKILSHENYGLVDSEWTVMNNDDFELVTPVKEPEVKTDVKLELGEILKALKDYMETNNLEVVQGNGVMATTLNLVK